MECIIKKHYYVSEFNSYIRTIKISMIKIKYLKSEFLSNFVKVTKIINSSLYIIFYAYTASECGTMVFNKY